METLVKLENALVRANRSYLAWNAAHSGLRTSETAMRKDGAYRAVVRLQRQVSTQARILNAIEG